MKVNQCTRDQVIEEIKADLDQLSLDLVAAKRLLFSSRSSTSHSTLTKSRQLTASPHTSEHAATLTSSRTSLKSRSGNNDCDKVLHARPKLGARISSAFRLPKLNRRKKSIPVERQGLLDRKDSMVSDLGPDEVDGPSRQGSVVSDTTLVDEDSAGYLLDLLAPLITGVQKLAPKIVQLSSESSFGIDQRLSSNPKVRDDFFALCAEISQVLESLIMKEGPDGLEIGHEHEREMRGLMLVALVKKVDTEVQSVRHPTLKASMPVNDPPILESMSQALKLSAPVTGPSPASPTSSSPLLTRPQTNNPFVLHSNSIRRNAVSQNPSPGLGAIAEGRKASVSVPIGVSAGGARGAPPASPGSFSTFVGGAQSSLWATNIRLASLQNSLLFSPSPIAVRRVVGHAAR